MMRQQRLTKYDGETTDRSTLLRRKLHLLGPEYPAKVCAEQFPFPNPKVSAGVFFLERRCDDLQTRAYMHDGIVRDSWGVHGYCCTETAHSRFKKARWEEIGQKRHFWRVENVEF